MKLNALTLLAIALAVVLAAYFLIFGGGEVRNCIARIALGGAVRPPDCSDNDGTVKRMYINDLYLGEVDSVPEGCWLNPSTNPACQPHIQGRR